MPECPLAPSEASRHLREYVGALHVPPLPLPLAGSTNMLSRSRTVEAALGQALVCQIEAEGALFVSRGSVVLRVVFRIETWLAV